MGLPLYRSSALGFISTIHLDLKQLRSVAYNSAVSVYVGLASSWV